MDERITKLKTPESCEQFAKNAEKMGQPEAALAARRKAIELRAAQHGAKTDAERELWRLYTHMNECYLRTAAKTFAPLELGR